MARWRQVLRGMVRSRRGRSKVAARSLLPSFFSGSDAISRREGRPAQLRLCGVTVPVRGGGSRASIRFGAWRWGFDLGFRFGAWRHCGRRDSGFVGGGWQLTVDLAFVGDGLTRARFCLQYGMRDGVMRRGERRHHGGSHGSFGDPAGSTEGEEEIVCQVIAAKILD
ncbi:hypothetical protein LR48_Vigan03g170900 [Vigna angularis]|uniref:Uncharacterized protein n=1 Tax=Phaseolus angularis TaxID=3914 RepID=A0A0L9U6M0_PHAAN|nr:hypothetical protein LR48_Vigan03g170900 [Vigna angularis]